MKVLILTADSNGGYPVPAVKGGAVSTLIEHLVRGNNAKHLCDMEVVSFYDKEAEKKAAEEYPNIKFTWIKVPVFLKLLDTCAFNFIRFIKKNGKAISFKSPFSLLYYIKKAKRLTAATDADKIVIENNVPMALIMKNNPFKGKWYYHFHNVPRIDAGCRVEFQKVTRFLCVSKFVADKICSIDSAIGKIEPGKACFLPNCIDTNLFRPILFFNEKLTYYQKKYNLKDTDFVIIFTGRMSEEKGADKLLEAMPLLPKKVKCLVVGSLLAGANISTPYQAKLHALANKLGERVIFTGYIDQKELPYLYNLADVAVLPSMWDEPAGLTIIEAMACKTPVITTNAGGIPEYAGPAVQLERNESIVEKIAESVSRFLDNPGYQQQMAEMALQHVKNYFDAEEYIDKFVESVRK